MGLSLVSSFSTTKSCVSSITELSILMLRMSLKFPELDHWLHFSIHSSGLTTKYSRKFLMVTGIEITMGDRNLSY